MNYEDILYREAGGVATITINRPSVYNAFRARTVDELLHAFQQAGWNPEIGVIVLTGAGDQAFCTGGDQTSHGDGGYGGRGTIGLPVDALQSLIRDVPKPVIARVNGYAIGGGNVLVTVCDLAIASEAAQLGQVGPRVGSVDPGFGTALLARVLGENARGKCGSCAGATRRATRLRWGGSMRSCLPIGSTGKSRDGATKSLH